MLKNMRKKWRSKGYVKIMSFCLKADCTDIAVEIVVEI